MSTSVAEFPSVANGYLQGASVEVKDIQSLTDKTVFLKVRFGCLGNSRKVDLGLFKSCMEQAQQPEQTDPAQQPEQTDPAQQPEQLVKPDETLLRLSKTLLDSEELEAIKKADGKMRQYLYNTCLPFDVGTSLLPVGLIAAVQEKLTEYKTTRETLVNTFIAAYPALCQKAAQRLGSLYQAHEYPPADSIKAKFVFDWQYVSFGVPGHLKSISAGLFAVEQEKAEQQMQAATEEITLLMRQSLLEMVSHLQERLSPGDEGKPKIFRESAVKNLQEFLTTFELRNVTNDKELAEQVAKARALISGTNAEALRNSDIFREKIRLGMAAIGSSLSEMVEEKAGRKYRTE